MQRYYGLHPHKLWDDYGTIDNVKVCITVSNLISQYVSKIALVLHDPNLAGSELFNNPSPHHLPLHTVHVNWCACCFCEVIRRWRIWNPWVPLVHHRFHIIPAPYRYSVCGCGLEFSNPWWTLVPPLFFLNFFCAVRAMPYSTHPQLIQQYKEGHNSLQLTLAPLPLATLEPPPDMAAEYRVSQHLPHHFHALWS